MYWIKRVWKIPITISNVKISSHDDNIVKIDFSIFEANCWLS